MVLMPTDGQTNTEKRRASRNRAGRSLSAKLWNHMEKAEDLMDNSTSLIEFKMGYAQISDSWELSDDENELVNYLIPPEEQPDDN